VHLAWKEHTISLLFLFLLTRPRSVARHCHFEHPSMDTIGSLALSLRVASPSKEGTDSSGKLEGFEGGVLNMPDPNQGCIFVCRER
jgi:hypothetical protein